MLKKFFFILPLLLISQAHALNLQSYRFSDSYRYSLLEDTLLNKFPGKYVATASYGYVHTPFYYSDTYLHDLKGEIIDSNHVLTAGYTYYLSRDVAVGIDLNAVHNTVFDESYTSLADTVLEAKINVLREETFAISLNPQVILPTGKTENFSTVDSLGAGLRIVGEKSYEKLHFLASVGALTAKNNHYVDVDHRQLLLSQLGVAYDLSEKLNVNFETFRRFPLVNDTLQDEGKYFITAKHKTGERFSTYFGAGVSAIDEVQNNTYSGFVGIKFHEATPVADTVALAAAAPVRELNRAPREELYFEHDKYQLRPQHQEKLKEYLGYFQEAKGEISEVVIEGYASSVGTETYNMNLSRKRAQSVREYLISNGLPENMFSIQALGETAPQHEEEWMNRRVQFSIKQ